MAEQQKSKHPRHSEQVVCGHHASLAALAARLPDVLRLFYHRELVDDLKPFLSLLAQQKAIYRQVEDEELSRIAGSRTHQGLVVVLRLADTHLLDLRTISMLAKQPGTVIALDGVGNPHNLGAIARTAAFFGAKGLILSDQGATAICSTAAYRTAEGGMEALQLWRSADLATDIATFVAAGGKAVGLAVQAKLALDAVRGHAQTHGVLLVAGAEELGARPQVLRACSQVVRIDSGQGSAVQSLNVGVATGIALFALGN